MLADHAVDVCPADARLVTHRLYLGLAGFTSAYMVHQEFEELEVMPALSAALGVDELIAIDMAIVAQLTPEEMVYSASLMLPAMNVEDRVELVGGMQEGMPARDVRAGVGPRRGRAARPRTSVSSRPASASSPGSRHPRTTGSSVTSDGTRLPVARVESSGGMPLR